MTSPSHRFDTYEGAAPIVGVSSRTLRRWAKQGRLDVHVTADGQKLVDVDAALAIARQPAADLPDKPREIVSNEPLPPADAPSAFPAGPVIPGIPAHAPDPSDMVSGQGDTADMAFRARLADVEQAIILLQALVEDWEDRVAALEQAFADAMDPSSEEVE